MQNINYAFLLSRPVWGAWIEICMSLFQPLTLWSRPVWGAWIEIAINAIISVVFIVAPRMGRVD